MDDIEPLLPTELKRGSIISRGTFDRLPPSNKAADSLLSTGLPAGWRERADHYLEALDDLQMASDTDISSHSLQVCVEYEYEALPEQVRAQVYIPRHPGPPGVFFGKRDETDLRATLVEHRDEYDGFREIAARNSRFLIWNISTMYGNWLVLVLVLRQGVDKSKTEVAAWTIVHPERCERSSLDKSTVVERAQRILRERDIVWGDPELLPPRNLWVPPMNPDQHLADDVPRDTFSSGIRAFALTKELFSRIAYAVSAQMDEDRMLAEVFKPMSGWLNVDKVRRDMIGAASAGLIDALEGRARIAAIPVSRCKHKDINDEVEYILPKNIRVPDHRRHDLFIPNAENFDDFAILGGSVLGNAKKGDGNIHETQEEEEEDLETEGDEVSREVKNHETSHETKEEENAETKGEEEALETQAEESSRDSKEEESLEAKLEESNREIKKDETSGKSKDEVPSGEIKKVEGGLETKRQEQRLDINDEEESRGTKKEEAIPEKKEEEEESRHEPKEDEEAMTKKREAEPDESESIQAKRMRLSYVYDRDSETDCSEEA